MTTLRYRGPFWTPVTPETGSLFHAETHSLHSHFSLVREAVWKFGDAKDKDVTVKALDEADHAAIHKGEAVNESLEKVEDLLRSSTSSPTTDDIKAKAAERALSRMAPFHRGKNSVGDAVIFETYAEAMRREDRADVEFAFVTHNKTDFSADNGDHRQPHADLLPYFDGVRSKYWVSLADLLNDFDIDLLANYDLQLYGALQSRTLSEIQEVEELLFKQVWYNRHWNSRINIERGKVKVVTKEQWDAVKPRSRNKVIIDSVWQLAQEAARKTEAEVGIDNLGPWDTFEWGMINGKLSAIRWVLGDDWDMLDT
ncbi:PIN domain-containing protein [Mesorhizobium sp. 1M-11]|uniref:PIN domain-containing protein n=1 Tax=Mesorhizobium sp. 1M-11 TaxID=1529006 RepID=UPI0006C76378|nr:PIN domain-containing protein [Mesorhizobium sp. 1M-11]